MGSAVQADAVVKRRTLLVLFALIVFDHGTEERLLFAGQWLRHGCGWSLECVDDSTNATHECFVRKEFD